MKQLALLILMMLLPLMASADAVEIDGIYYNLVEKSTDATTVSTIYSWAGSESGSIESGGKAIASDGESVNYINGSDDTEYYVIRVNKRKGGIATEYVEITLDEPLQLGDQIAITGYRNKDIDVNGTLYILFENGAEIDEGEEVKWNNIHPDYGQKPNTNTYTITDAAGSKSFKIARSEARTNLYITAIKITRTNSFGIAEVTSNPNKYEGDVTIPNIVVYEGTTYSVTSIGVKAFSSCYGLTSVSIPNSVTSIGNFAFYCSLNISSVNIPNSVTSIGDNAFDGCSKLTNMVIPNSVTSIGSYAFWLCSGLTSVTIPNSLISAGLDAFYGCSSLEAVHITDIESWLKISFRNSSSNPLFYAHHLYIEKNEVKDLVIPQSVSSIGNNAFIGGSELTSVTIPNGVSFIGESAFKNCTGINSITIPNSVTSIGSYAFYGCNSISSLNIGTSVRTINYDAFANCPEMTDVFCYVEQVPYTSIASFDGSNINYATLHVPASAVANYKAATPWSGFKNIVAIGSETISDEKLLYANDISSRRGTQVTIPIQLDNDKTISGFQFDVSLPEGIQYVSYEKTSRLNNHSISYNQLSGNKIRFLVTSLQDKEIAVSTGAVLNLTVSIPEGMTAGDYSITLSNIELNHNEGSNVETINQDDVTSKLTVIAAKPGDANGDGKVSVTDVTSIINYILQKIPSTFVFEAADVNGDGKISVTDVTKTINIVLGKTSATARKRETTNEIEPE